MTTETFPQETGLDRKFIFSDWAKLEIDEDGSIELTVMSTSGEITIVQFNPEGRFEGVGVVQDGESIGP